MARDPNSRLVYSTDGERVTGEAPSRARRAEAPKPAGTPSRTAPPADGWVRVQRTKAGRGGKTVTLVTGLPGSPAEIEATLKTLKQLCGAGGTIEDRDVVIQGDHRERVRTRLEAMGHRVKLAGG